MGGIANNPQVQQAMQLGQGLQQPQQPQQPAPQLQNYGKPGNPFLAMHQGAGYFSPANQDAINQDIQNAQNGIFLGPGGQGGGIFGGPTQLTPTMAPKPMPIPGRPIIDPVRPGYGQRPQRGPAPRDITPSTLQQGLGGLGGLNKIGGMM